MTEFCAIQTGIRISSTGIANNLQGHLFVFPAWSVKICNSMVYIQNIYELTTTIKHETKMLLCWKRLLRTTSKAKFCYNVSH